MFSLTTQTIEKEPKWIGKLRKIDECLHYLWNSSQVTAVKECMGQKMIRVTGWELELENI